MSTAAAMPEGIVIRRATAADAEACGVICYEAFARINQEHNFPPDVPAPEHGIRLMGMLFGHAGFFCVVGEQNGRVVGSNCLDERGPIGGVGPITIDPAAQNSGVGRQLMAAVMNRVAERNLAGARLVQAAFHARSMSLYAKLGFDIQEPLVVMQGAAIKTNSGFVSTNPEPREAAGYAVRAAEASDLEACNALCQRVHGHQRSGELADAIQQGEARVAERNGRITAYSTAVAFFGHSVAENNEGMQALIGAAEAFGGPGFLLPTRNTELFRWCLKRGLRVVEPMTLMSYGLYTTPRGAFLPSILY